MTKRPVSVFATAGATLAALALFANACGPPAPGDAKASAAAPGEDEVRVYSTLPAFSLTDQTGGPFASERLAGLTWIGNFIFTRCPGTCPVQTRNLKLLQDRLRQDAAWGRIRLVSFTVDPVHDTPEVLDEYARRSGADPQHWIFLTGEREDLWRLSKEGFKLPVGDAPPGGDGPILHATQLVLVDGAGRVRGYYDGMQEQGLRELRRDLQRVLAER